MMDKQHLLHWNPKIPRHGIGQNLTHIRHSTLFVSDLRKSVDFYSNIMKFKVLTMDKENGSATLSMKNMVLELKVGATTAFAGENLIVGHISVDVPDSKLAFDYLTQKKVRRPRPQQMCILAKSFLLITILSRTRIFTKSNFLLTFE